MTNLEHHMTILMTFDDIWWRWWLARVRSITTTTTMASGHKSQSFTKNGGQQKCLDKALLGSFSSTIIDEQRGRKYQNRSSRQSEIILGVDLMGLYPWTPLGVLKVCSKAPCCFPRITHYLNDPRRSNYTRTTTQIQILFHIFWVFKNSFMSQYLQHKYIGHCSCTQWF